MARIEIELTAAQIAWIKRQIADGAAGSVGEYLVDLVQQDQTRAAKIAHLRALVEEGLASGVSKMDPRDLIEIALSQENERSHRDDAA